MELFLQSKKGEGGPQRTVLGTTKTLAWKGAS